MTQVDLAAVVGTSQPTISAIEQGRIPRLSLAHSIALALGVTVGDLFPSAVPEAAAS